MRTLSLRMPEALDAKLSNLARKRGKSKSELVRVAVEALVNGRARGRFVSCHDLSGDLVGCAEGPRDLSCNQKHMRGFGR